MRPSCSLIAADVVVERVVVEQVAFVGPAARVADHAGRSAGQCDRSMTGILEATQHDQPDQVADVQAVGGRIAAVVDRHLAVRHRPSQRLTVGRVVDEVASLEIGDEIGASHTLRKGTVAPWPTHRMIRASTTNSGAHFEHFSTTSTPTGAAVRRARRGIVARDRSLTGCCSTLRPRSGFRVLLFACVHELLLEHPEPELAQWYPNLTETHRPPDGPGTGADLQALRRANTRERLELLLATRTTQTNEVGPLRGRCSRRSGCSPTRSAPLGLLDVGASGGLNLMIDRYQYRYERTTAIVTSWVEPVVGRRSRRTSPAMPRSRSDFPTIAHALRHRSAPD